MANSKKKKSGDVRTLVLEGDLTIQRAAEIKKAFDGSFDGVKKLVLNLEKVDEIDLSCLQIFCSAHRTSAKMEKELVIDGECPEVLKKVIESAGFTRQTGCSKDYQKSCFWIKGGI